MKFPKKLFTTVLIAFFLLPFLVHSNNTSTNTPWVPVKTYHFNGPKLLEIHQRLTRDCRYFLENQTDRIYHRHCDEGEFDDDVVKGPIIADEYCRTLVFSDFYPAPLMARIYGPENLIDPVNHSEPYSLEQGITFACAYNAQEFEEN